MDQIEVGCHPLKSRIEGIGVTIKAGVKGSWLSLKEIVKRKVSRSNSHAFRNVAEQRDWQDRFKTIAKGAPIDVAPVIDLSDRKHWQHHPEQVLRLIKQCQAVVQKPVPFRHLLEPDDLTSRGCYRIAKKIYRLFEKTFDGGKKLFAIEVAKQRGRQLPSIVHRWGQYEERVLPGSVALGAKYLELCGLDLQAQYARSLGTQGIRCSELKKPEETQGATINLRRHELKDGDTCHVIIRSGGFCRHGGKWDKNVLIAQALPKLAMTLKEGLHDLTHARRTGKFLYAEQSLMSDQTRDESKMIEDMQWTMEQIGKRVKVRFGSEDDVAIESENIVLILEADEALWGDEFGVESVFFTQGINTRQSIGYGFKKHNDLQNTINLKGVKQLVAYGGLTALAHFSKGKCRAVRDVAGIKAISQCVRELGGQLNYVCKSGKDRTGALVAAEFAQAFGPSVMKRVQMGGCRKIAGQNVALHRKDRYALNMFQMLPKQLGPPTSARVMGCD